MTLFRHCFYVKNKHGFGDAVVDRKGDGFAETGAAVLVVVLRPTFLGDVPFGCVWKGEKRGVCEVAVRRSCCETDAVEVFWERVAGSENEVEGRQEGREGSRVSCKMVARDLDKRGWWTRWRKALWWKKLCHARVKLEKAVELRANFWAHVECSASVLASRQENFIAWRAFE